ncbi:MAG: hypothetical protein JW941_00795 [Candidatus Coatesbacteria bacterium]|nr:hypothetical protein [Candidatus Coatesbacteria bacterium]
MKDRLGSIINILDENETVKTTYSYDAFGDPTATYPSGQIDCMYRCPRHSDAPFGFNRDCVGSHVPTSPFRLRRPGPSSPCPIIRGRSLYAYCSNGPANFTDPSGRVNCSSEEYKEDCLSCRAFEYGLRVAAAYMHPSLGTSVSAGTAGGLIATNYVSNYFGATGYYREQADRMYKLGCREGR